jgi:hypothetical protein
MKEIMSLVRLGTYESIEQFVEVAARNQLVYERGRTADARVPELVQAGSRTAQGSAGHSLPITTTQASGTLATLRLAESYAGTPQPIGPVALPKEHRIWGQVNRLLPIKLVVRFVLNVASSTNGWPKLNEVRPAIGDAAAKLGSHLRHLDSAMQRRRDELFATGLPREDHDPSWIRFVTQFIARTTRDGRVYPGAVCQYPLASISEGIVGLTDLGIAFAKLSNPMIDDVPERAINTLSAEERRFFVERIVSALPTELTDFSVALRAVSEGETSPGALTSALSEVLRRDPSTHTWTDVMIRTHISGVVARMVDLGLLHRRWDGRLVTYSIDAHIRSHFGHVFTTSHNGRR